MIELIGGLLIMVLTHPIFWLYVIIAALMAITGDL